MILSVHKSIRNNEKNTYFIYIHTINCVFAIRSTHVPLAHSTRATAAALALPPFHLSAFHLSTLPPFHFHLSTSTPQVPRTPLSPLQAPLRGNFAVGRRPSGPAAARCRSPLLGLVSSVFVRLVLRLTPLRNCAGFCYTSFRLEKRPL